MTWRLAVHSVGRGSHGVLSTSPLCSASHTLTVSLLQDALAPPGGQPSYRATVLPPSHNPRPPILG